MKVTIAHAIFQINGDATMGELVLKEMPQLDSWTEIIDLLYLLPDFKDARVAALLHQFRESKEYLIAYNATRVLGLSTDEVVKKFRELGA